MDASCTFQLKLVGCSAPMPVFNAHHHERQAGLACLAYGNSLKCLSQSYDGRAGYVCVVFAAILQHLSVLGLPASAELHRQQLKAAFHKAAMQVRMQGLLKGIQRLV